MVNEMGKDNSVTKSVSSNPQPLANLLGSSVPDHYETTITRSDGSKVTGSGSTSEASQKAASSKK